MGWVVNIRTAPKMGDRIVNVRIGRISHLLTPGYSWCLRCKTSWPFVKYHATDYAKINGNGHGCFPLCTKCWAELTPMQRLPFYRALIESWYAGGRSKYSGMTFDEEWALVNDAVLAGR